MAENKTVPNDLNVQVFLNSVENETKREDSFKILELMQEITAREPVMWGTKPLTESYPTSKVG